MKLVHIRIHNFRGILDESFDLHDYTLLVGPNNAGKSTVVDALRAFYEKDGFKFRKDVDFPFIAPQDDESWIEVQYSLKKEEKASLAEDYHLSNDRLHVRKYFKANDPGKNNCIFGYTPTGLCDTQFYGQKNVQHGKFGDVIYIPAVSKVDEHTKLSGPSALRDLLSGVLEDVVKESESFRSLTKAFNTFAGSVKQEKTTDDRSIAGFEEDLSTLLAEWGVSFSIQMKSPSVADIVKQLIDHECNDSCHQTPLRPDNFGSGFQRHFIYSLITLGPKYLAKKKASKTKEFAPDFTLILFEEPEAFLHPPQQDVLASNLREISTSESRQVLCTTHSSHFVSRNMTDLPSIVRMSRKGGGVRAFQLCKADWDRIVDGNQKLNEIAQRHKELQHTLSEDDLTPEMEAVKYCLWMNPDRASAFFANNVLLVEGPTEQSLITRLFSEKKIPVPQGGIYVLDCFGKINIHRFMNILIHLGTPHSVIYDDDSKKAYHPEVHALINDSRHSQYTRHIEPLAHDIENFLGVTPTSKHRKPQHMMYLYSTDQIDASNIQRLCEAVGRCVDSFQQ
jgi:putative ATP-dependent endonuclease of the OLD family